MHEVTSVSDVLFVSAFKSDGWSTSSGDEEQAVDVNDADVKDEDDCNINREQMLDEIPLRAKFAPYTFNILR
jgi:hypothetical protein